MEWILIYFISCGIFCQSGKQEVLLPSEDSCLKQMAMIEERVEKSGDDILYLHCKQADKD